MRRERRSSLRLVDGGVDLETQAKRRGSIGVLSLAQRQCLDLETQYCSTSVLASEIEVVELAFEHSKTVQTFI